MADETAKPTKERSIYRLFKDDKGEIGSRATANTVAIIFKYPDGESDTFNLADAFGGTLPPPGVGRAAAAFGISTSAGNAGNTTKGDTREAVQDRLEVFESGNWSTEAGGGPRLGVFFEALTEFRRANNADVSEDRMNQIRKDLADDPEKQKNWMKHDGFKAVYAQIVARKAAERAAKLQSAAGTSTADAGEMLA